MPIYMKYEGIDGSFLEVAQLPTGMLGGGEWSPYPGAAMLAAQLRRQYPAGVDSILIGLLKVPGYRVVRRAASGGLNVAAGDVNGDGNGIIAILIGLLLPAVQKLQTETSGDRQILKGALKRGGRLAVLMDGSVRGAAGLKSAHLPAIQRPSQDINDIYIFQSPPAASNLPTGRRT